MVKRPTLDDIVYYSKRYGAKAARATARGIHDAAEWTWDNAHPIWHKYSKPALAATVAYLGVTYTSDTYAIPIINSALDFIAPVTDLVTDPLSNAIDLRGRVQQFYGYGPIRDQMIAVADAGIGYVSNNFLPVTARALGVVAGWKLFNAVKVPRVPPLPQGNRFIKDKSRRAFLKTAALAGTGLTLSILYMAIEPEFNEGMKRFGGTDITKDLDEAFEKEEFSNAGLQDLREELLSLKSVNKARMQKDASYLRKLGYQNISDEDLYYLARTVSGEAGNYFRSRNHAERQRRDMNAIVNVIFTRYLASKDNDGFKNDFDGGGEVTFKDIVLRRRNLRRGGEFSIANSWARRRMWEIGYLSGNLTFGTGKARSKTLFAYANTVHTLAQIAHDPTRDPTRGALNYKNNAVGYARAKQWHETPARHLTRKYTHDVEAHSYYSYYDRNGENYGLKIRGEAKERGRL